ncbi:DUF2267 domain-containing protein [Sagittula salina]|uniref:DUF2267 domain-containing protein n=1 Tax=Sagittula salina TaxID=2820268 RepID=A0A940MSC0_9RHOB|nr:DUF2267 domain-containing protein [Sagittula salina]MBP0482099.1 DUF2267 domain-containing protein [Sagittula salina]
MSTTGHPAVDEAPQVVAEWLNLLCDDLDWQERGRAYLLLTEVLHALRDYLGVDEAADLAAQLPLILRGIYYTGWNPSKTPEKPRSKEAFLSRVAAPFSKAPLEDPERAVAAVFDLLRRKVSMGEIDQVAGAMRGPLQALWD